MAKNATAFKTGQHIVYPLQGVGVIQTIEKREFKGKEAPFYVMYFEALDMTIRLPAESAETQGLRCIVPGKESEKALEIISAEHSPVQTDWKIRYQMNLELVRKGKITDIATVVAKLYHRSRLKELPILERKLYDSALNLLIDEIAYSLEKDKKEVEQMIFTRLEPEEEEIQEPVTVSDTEDMSVPVPDQESTPAAEPEQILP